MLVHGAGIGYTGPQMGPIDNFSLVTGSQVDLCNRSNYMSEVFGVTRRSTCMIVSSEMHQ